MEPSDHEIGEKGLEIWDEMAHQIKARFNLSSPRPRTIRRSDDIPANIISTYANPNEGTILVSSALLKRGISLRPVIAKACLMSALPSDLLCEECLDDLSFEFAFRQIQDPIAIAEWNEVWSSHSPARKESTVLSYDPRNAYDWLYSLLGDEGLDVIVRELTLRVKNRIPLSFDDYLQYFSMRMQNFVVPLDRTELKVVRHLVEKPNLSKAELAKLVGVSPEWISRKIGLLKGRMILREFRRVPFSRIGIQMYNLMLQFHGQEEDGYALLRECPFLYSFQRGILGPWNVFATICIPENSKSFDYFKTGLELLKKRHFTVRIHSIYSSGLSHCFDCYSISDSTWDIPWELINVNLRRIHSDNLYSSIRRIDSPVAKTDLELDELDMRILECVRCGISSVSTIRRQLGVGQRRVADKLKTLRKNGLVVRTWEPHNIGLTEQVLVYSTEEAISLAIAAWSQRLPRSIVSFSEENELMLTLQLPPGGSYGLAAAVKDLTPNVIVATLGPRIYGGWGFPISLWDPRYQRWKCPEESLERWISILE